METEQLLGDSKEHTLYTMEETNPQIRISRRVLMQEDLCEIPEQKRKIDLVGAIRRNLHPRDVITSVIPSISWLASYHWKDWLLKDAISGFTVAVMNIPQGMAYALLANVPPVVGIYMAFFPVIAYAFLGTSRHVSMGSFAVICLMTGNAISKHTNPLEGGYSVMEVGTAITFVAGLVQDVCWYFYIVPLLTIISVFSQYGLTVIGLTKPWLKNNVALYWTFIISKITAIPVPIELIVVLCGTMASYYGHIAKDYGLKTVGEIAKGLPSPTVPNFNLMPSVALDSAIIAIIAYIVSLSMALIFANKLKYEINANQELLAQLVLYLFRLGIVCTLLSDTLVSGFTAAAAVHVFTSQIKDILGISLPHISGTFKLIYTYKAIFEQFHKANTAALIISAITIVALLINNEVLKPRIAKITAIPVPIELIVVLCGTMASYYGHIAKDYGLKTVGEIAKGLPSPTVPNFNLMPSVALDSAIIAIIAYIVSLSMALIFANKLKYEINANQELLAQGVGNVVGSFFSCLPFSASLSRSVIQQSVGGCTQLASLISSAILLIILIWIGPFFEPLPRCVLAGLIVVALKGVLLQALDIFKIWKVSPLDGIIWLVTYFTVIVVGIEYGLLAGLGVSVIILILRGAQSSISNLERLPSTELYVEVDKFAKTEVLPGITILRYSGCLNFVNRIFFKNKMMALINSVSTSEENANSVLSSQEAVTQDIIIVDFKSLTYIDPSGAECLKSMIFELNRSKKTVFLAGLAGNSIEVLRICNVIEETGVPIFPSVHDAVIYAQSKQAGVFTIRL